MPRQVPRENDHNFLGSSMTLCVNQRGHPFRSVLLFGFVRFFCTVFSFELYFTKSTYLFNCTKLSANVHENATALISKCSYSFVGSFKLGPLLSNFVLKLWISILKACLLALFRRRSSSSVNIFGLIQ